MASAQALIRVADLPDVRILLDELDARRAAMKHADDLGIDVAAVIRLICPPVCETCKGSGKKPRPEGWDQIAHLDAGTCDCHDSWNQCECEHRVPECGCCPGGTGLCGPLPCPSCHGRPKHTLRDRLAELHDLLCSIAARCDDEHVIWDDVQTAITLAERLTDEAEAVTP